MPGMAKVEGCLKRPREEHARFLRMFKKARIWEDAGEGVKEQQNRLRRVCQKSRAREERRRLLQLCQSKLWGIRDREKELLREVLITNTMKVLNSPLRTPSKTSTAYDSSSDSSSSDSSSDSDSDLDTWAAQLSFVPGDQEARTPGAGDTVTSQEGKVYTLLQPSGPLSSVGDLASWEQELDLHLVKDQEEARQQQLEQERSASSFEDPLKTNPTDSLTNIDDFLNSLL